MFKNIEDFKKIIEKSEKIVLINHIKMDADAFGSLGAFYLVLEKIGKQVKAINDSEAPEDFNFLLKKRIIEPDLNLEKYSPDLIISFDAASESQLGKTFIENKKIFKEKDFIVIDHHKTNPKFGKINFVYLNYSSTCELLFDMMNQMDYRNLIDKEIATLLIAGIHTDTNIFYNQNTTSNTLKVASELIKIGADFRSPIYNFFHKISLKRLKLFGKAISSLDEYKEGSLIYGYLKKEDFENTNTTLDDTTGIINKLSNIENNEAIFMVYEIENGVKISFRSKNLDIGSFCASFENGGGHKNAAGFYIKNVNIKEAIEIILTKFKKYFQKK